MTTINSVGNGLSGTTGSGNFVGATSPTLVTPTLGVASATSINFGGSALSNYVSETSWTPVVTFATPGDLTVAYTQQTATYIRIGNLVTVNLIVQFTPTYTTASGMIEITGLPFTSTNLYTNFGSCLISAITFIVGTTYLVPAIGANVTFIKFYGVGSGGIALLSTTQFPTGTAYLIEATITYMV